LKEQERHQERHKDGPDYEIVTATVENPFLAAQPSREVFLNNEAQSRQREARNFQFQGDHTAPVSLRSGRIMARRGLNELDEYGAEIQKDDNEGVDHGIASVVEDIPSYVSGHLDSQASAATELVPLAAPPSYHLVRTAFYSQVISSIIRQTAERDVSPASSETESVLGLTSLLTGTVERGEGNSCLLIGARGSGKTRVSPCISRSDSQAMRRALSIVNDKVNIQNKPVVVRLSGLIHVTDRLAIREMGRQINEAEGQTIAGEEEEEDEAEVRSNVCIAIDSRTLHLLPSHRTSSLS
jgi:origin recognition complex subunit 4